MGVFRNYLERSVSSYGRSAGEVDKLEADAAEIVRHGVQSMIAEGQEPREAYDKAFHVFGENFLEKAGVIELVAEARETK